MREFWYSPALGINLRSTRDDPRSGNQTFTVTELSTDEPDPAMGAARRLHRRGA